MAEQRRGKTLGMDCSDIHTHCQPLLDKQLEPGLLREVEAHLDACPACAKTVEAQRTFHHFLSRAVLHSAGNPSEDLRKRVLTPVHMPVQKQASQARRIIPMGDSQRGVHGMVAAAASFMLGLSGLIGFQSACINKQCPLVMAAEHEHVRIIAGAHNLLADETNPAQFVRSFSKAFERFKSVPDLSDCQLTCTGGGTVHVGSLPQGIFLKYVDCVCDLAPATLMVVKSESTPYGEPIGFKNKQFLSASFSGRNVISWHTEKDGLLYILVTERPLKDALEVADLVRR